MQTQDYQKIYKRSLEEPETFWAEQAEKYLTWQKKWEHVLQGNFKDKNVRWFSGGQLNVSYNCLDRHLPEKANDIAIIWQGDDPAQHSKMTYQELYEAVCRFANVLKRLNIKKGDRVCIYLPMLPEAAVAMLACTRIGAVHSVVFAGFSSAALKNRVNDAECDLIITADGGIRGGKMSPLKNNVDDIMADCPSLKNVIVVKNTAQKIRWNEKDLWYHELMEKENSDCPIEPMEATDPLFILYTSGSTGQPKGILHGTGGYLLHATMSFKLIFNYTPGDIYWCTADIGWVTGHSYLIYGPLANGATTVMFGGIPTYPSPSRFWEVIDQHQVNIFYTAPTALRSIMREGDHFVTQTSRKSLKLLGSVGEPINPRVWLWYYNVVGEMRCPVVDTWWQTETGGIMITPLPHVTPPKPGAASWPFFGIEPKIVDEKGEGITDHKSGNLIITRPWPGQLQTVYKDPKRFEEMYFSDFPGNYSTGDEAHQDADGYFWISGRADDVLNVSGHRFDTAELENIIVSHPKVSESAVVGIADEIKGQGVCAFVTLETEFSPSEELFQELNELLRKEIGPIAKIDKIHWTNDLPKTRSGKIMRRILRKIVNNEREELGDISTLANPDVVQKIIEQVDKGYH